MKIEWRSTGHRLHAVQSSFQGRRGWMTLCGVHSGIMTDPDGKPKCRTCLARMKTYGFVEKEIDAAPKI